MSLNLISHVRCLKHKVSQGKTNLALCKAEVVGLKIGSFLFMSDVRKFFPRKKQNLV